MWNWTSKLEELRQDRKGVAVVTLIDHHGSSPREAGAKILVLADGRFFGTIGGGKLEQLVIEDAKKLLNQNSHSQLIKYPLGAKTGQCCGGTVSLFFELLNSGPKLYVFGVGHVGQALCKTLLGTPFSVHAIDQRTEWIESNELPSETHKHACEWEDFIDETLWDEQSSYVAIMTHRHDHDQEILAKLLKKPIKYLGLIGSSSKWARFKQRLEARGYTAQDFARVHCPIGLKTGGKSPQEVAISVAAELLKIHYDRQVS